MSLSVRSKVGFSAAIVVVLTLSILIALFNKTSESTLLVNQKKIISLHAERQVAFLEEEINQIKKDVLFLSKSNSLLKSVNSDYGIASLDGLSRNNNRGDLIDEFIRLIKAKGNYLQIRLIGVADNGKELIRVNNRITEVEIVAPEKLQNKGDSAYYQETLRLPEGRMYISDIDYNHEHGVVEIPEIPVIRISTPLYTKAGVLSGIIIINNNLTDSLNRLSGYLDNGELFRIDFPSGRFIEGDQSGYSMGFEEYVDTKYIVRGNGRNQYDESSHEDEIIVHKHMNIMDDKRITFTLRKPISIIQQENVQMIRDNDKVYLLLFIFGILLAAFLSRLPLRQLTEVSRIVRSIARGHGTKDDLPILQNNEIGDLSRAFFKLLNKIESSEEDLRSSKEQLELAISGSSDGIWDWNIETNHFYFSQRYKEMLGYTNKDFNKGYASLKKFIHPEDLERLDKYTTDFIAGGSDKYHIEYRMRHKNGSYVDFLSRGHAIRGSSGKAIRIVGINSDISEQNQTTSRMIAYEKQQKISLVREVHHRIKNNLQGVASLLRQHAELNPSVKDQLEAAISQVYTMGIVHGIQGKDEYEGIPVSGMLDQIIFISEDITNKKITYEGSNKYCQYHIYEKEAVPIALVLNELVTNACKHSKSGSSVSILALCNWCLEESISIDIINEVDYFPKEFSVEEKKGLGTGLNLVVSLLPPEGASLSIHEEDGICTTKLILSSPILYVRSTLNIGVGVM